MPTLRRPYPYTRVGLVRKWWHHRVRHHPVLGTVVRDMRVTQKSRIEFYYRRGWTCPLCRTSWP